MFPLRTCEKGQTALPLVLLIGSIIVEIAVTAALLSSFAIKTGAGERLGLRALVAANAGIRDAQIKIVRNKEFILGASGTATSTLTLGDDRADITLVKETDATNNTYVYTIRSRGSASNRRKQLVAIFVVNQTTGEVRLQSLKEEAYN